MAEVGGSDPRLTGLKAPQGVKVEIAAEGLIEGQLTAIAFGDDGTLYALAWNPRGRLKTGDEPLELANGETVNLPRSVNEAANDLLVGLHDTDGDGVFDQSRTVMDDLDLPSALLLHDGWFYWVSGGRLMRRRPHDGDLLRHLQAQAEAKTGPPTGVTADGRWIEQPLVRGLAALIPGRAAGLAIGPDGSLYITVSGGTSVTQSWDGSQAAIVRSGGVIRMQPDGSRVEEFARGLCDPHGPIAFGAFGSAFVADRDWEGANRTGLRLIQVLERADFGWQHASAARPAELADAIDQPDPTRPISSTGGRPGTLPPLAQLKGGLPGGVLLYSGTQLPEPLRGSLLVCDPVGGAVRVLGLTREGLMQRAATAFSLLEGDPDQLPPDLAIQGPDGAIYVSTSATPFAEGRIYRLSWSGTDDLPAIELAKRDGWAAVAKADDDALCTLLDSEDGEVRRRASFELIQRAKRDGAAAAAFRQRLIEHLSNPGKPEASRAAALFASTYLADDAVRGVWLALLSSQQLELRRLATEALGNHPPRDKEKVQEFAEHVQNNYASSREPLVTRTEHLTLGKLAVAGSTSAAEWSFEGTSVTFTPRMHPLVFDGHVRALELAPGAAKELMTGNLFVAIDFDVTEFDERQRLKNFVVVTAEAMRTRELADFLDALLRGKEDYLAKIESPLEARLIAAYQNVLTMPPVDADAVAEWIEKHPGGPAEVELAALETLSLVGTTRPAVKENLAASLVKEPETAKQVATSMLAGRIDRALAPHVASALREHAAGDATGESATLAEQIEKLPPKP